MGGTFREKYPVFPFNYPLFNPTLFVAHHHKVLTET